MVYFSIDIETNGLAAGINSMISLGAAAIDAETNKIVAIFKQNLRPAAGLIACPDTMKWWDGQPDAYKAATENAKNPEDVMWLFSEWVTLIHGAYNKGVGEPVAACWKPHFDYAFVRYYLHRFGLTDPFGRSGSGLDIKTLTALALGQPFNGTKIGDVPAEWRERETHDHDALGDAIEQAHVFYHARKALQAKL